MPGFPILHLQEFTQTHVHRVSDAIQPFHPQSYTTDVLNTRVIKWSSSRVNLWSTCNTDQNPNEFLLLPFLKLTSGFVIYVET